MDSQINITEIVNAENTELASKVVQSIVDDKNELRNIGILGRFFGKKDCAVVNILGVVLIIFVVCLFCFLFFYTDDAATTFPKKDVVTLLLPVITTMVGYLVGKQPKE